MKKSVPMGRYGRAEEIADVVLWLSSDAASYVTGQSISVDGGFIMR
jgi:NAD(P)-dependent dehydrogenase (short-subunit alcohol dehydrogenase family)